MTTGLKWMMILCKRWGNYLSHSLKYKFQLASKLNPGTRLNQHCRVLPFKENLWSRFLWVWGLNLVLSISKAHGPGSGTIFLQIQEPLGPVPCTYYTLLNARLYKFYNKLKQGSVEVQSSTTTSKLILHYKVQPTCQLSQKRINLPT
jgi:hypothetical protein